MDLLHQLVNCDHFAYQARLVGPLGIVGAADQGHVDSNISWRLKAFSSSGWFRVRMAACCFFSPGSWLDQELRPMILSQSVDCW
jgi:hypothetical protein